MWYAVDAENGPGGPATISARDSTITFDGSAGTGELYPGPADLLAAALAACILKNVERFSGLLQFRYEHAHVRVEIERQEPPPRIARARYTLRMPPANPSTASSCCTATSSGSGRSPTRSLPRASSTARSPPSRPPAGLAVVPQRNTHALDASNLPQ